MVKYAILCGIDYNNTLHSSSHIANMINFLVQKCDYYSNNITIVSDCRDLTKTQPTKIHIMNSMYFTINKCNPGDTLFFYYSGHSSLERVRGDVFDNIIVSSDQVCIQNDELYKILIQNLPNNITLYAFFDCCQSDKMFDLPYHIESKVIYNPQKIQRTINNIEKEKEIEKEIDIHGIYSFLQFEQESPCEQELPCEQESPCEYNDMDWSNDFTIESGKYIHKNNKIYIFSSYVEKKYLHNNCEYSHGDFTNCFIEFINDNCTTNNDGIRKFNQNRMLDILKGLSCRLSIKKSLQKVKLSVLRIDDIIDVL
jgi:hypothetical protein